MDKVRIFISYAKDDFKMMKLIEHICRDIKHITYERKKYEIEVWCDQYIVGGDNWRDTIIQRIKDADVIIFLLSPRFMQSNFIGTVEIPLALERRQNANISVLGIYMEECDYSEISVKKTQIVPQYQGRLKPVVLWRQQEGCWDAIRDGIEKCAYLSIDKMPWNNKSGQKALPVAMREKDFKHNAPAEIQLLQEFGLQKIAKKKYFEEKKRLELKQENDEALIKVVVIVALIALISSIILKHL
jgi:hypothetical protein